MTETGRGFRVEKAIEKRTEEVSVKKNFIVPESNITFREGQGYWKKVFDKIRIEVLHKRIALETGWSKKIVESIISEKQYEIYERAGLEEKEVDGRSCLVKKIDMDYRDPKTGLTNRELMQRGRSPVDVKTGEKIELHHMNQEFDGPLAELAENSEHGDGNDAILHDKQSDSWRQNPANSRIYNNVQRPGHWMARAREEG